MGKIKILVVDDELAKEIKEDLEDFEFQGVGCEIETSVTAKEAEEKIHRLKERKQFYDIIIIDMKMDESDEKGLELAEKGEILKLSSVKIVLTAFPSIRNCVKCLKADVFDYIDKNSTSYDPLEKLKESMKKGLEERLMERSDPFMKWLNQNLPEFIETYSDEHIAVIDETVVEQDADYDAHQKKVREKYPFRIPTIATVLRKEDEECLYL